MSGDLSYRTEDGVTVSTGDRVFNYYDRKAGEIVADSGDGWFDLRHDDGTRSLLDGSRVCSIAFAVRRGWIEETWVEVEATSHFAITADDAFLPCDCAVGMDHTLPDRDDEIGRPYSETDLSSPLIGYLGCEVEMSDGTVGVLSSVTVDGTATIAGYDGIVLAVVPAGEVVVR